MSVLALHLLGPFRLELGSTQQEAHLGHKAQALLTYVATRGTHGASRSSLAHLLWSRHGEDEARNSLRQCLHQIRHALGSAADWLNVDRDQLMLNGLTGNTDLWRFEYLACQGDLDALLGAAVLYHGNLAEGLSADLVADRWLASERERLRGVARAVVAHLSERVTVASEYEVATRLARQLLIDDPLHEGSYRSLMVLLDRQGLRAKALQVWDECQHVLTAAMMIEPSDQTRLLYEQLRGSPVAARIGSMLASSMPD